MKEATSRLSELGNPNTLIEHVRTCLFVNPKQETLYIDTDTLIPLLDELRKFPESYIVTEVKILDSIVNALHTTACTVKYCGIEMNVKKRSNTEIRELIAVAKAAQIEEEISMERKAVEVVIRTPSATGYKPRNQKPKSVAVKPQAISNVQSNKPEEGTATKSSSEEETVKEMFRRIISGNSKK